MAVSKWYDNIHLTLTDLPYLLCHYSIPSLVLGFGQQDSNGGGLMCSHQQAGNLKISKVRWGGIYIGVLKGGISQIHSSSLLIAEPAGRADERWVLRLELFFLWSSLSQQPVWAEKPFYSPVAPDLLPPYTSCFLKGKLLLLGNNMGCGQSDLHSFFFFFF